MLQLVCLLMFPNFDVLSQDVKAAVDVQSLNQEVTAEGKKKVDVLQATKDFKKGIYGLQWEHTWGAMEVLNNIPSPPPSAYCSLPMVCSIDDTFAIM